ncbi:unnamed protein product [Orchesella dallaii]|uniref:Gamma-glutamylcyclotransferase n=1 Tax=Orchesella dallaii TaxID=48710 RepID=A0ABP1QP21_9HEXA
MEFLKVKHFICTLIFFIQPFYSMEKALHESTIQPPLEIIASNFLNKTDFIPTNVNFTTSTKQLPPPTFGESACYPEANGASQYLIGYGSLMSTASKDRTYSNTGENVPVRIYGYSRLWNCKGVSVSYSTTYLGALLSANKSSYFNGVVFKLPSASAILDYDKRESFYCREEVPMSKLQMLAPTRRLAAGQYWIYVTRPEYDEFPTRTYPIVQSYVDTFLSGCFEMEEKFNIPGYADECISTTEEWVSPWVNDRIFPRRPFMHQPNAGKIDRLLNEKAPKAFRNIMIE